MKFMEGLSVRCLTGAISFSPRTKSVVFEKVINIAILLMREWREGEGQRLDQGHVAGGGQSVCQNQDQVTQAPC